MRDNVKLGIFVSIALIAIIISIFAVGSFTLGKTYRVYVDFPNISGLLAKAKVKIAGVDVGILKGVQLKGSKARLTLHINNDIVLYKNATASIVSMGIIGTKYIEIDPGDPSFGIVRDGDVITAAPGGSLEDTLSGLADKITKVFDGEMGKNGDMFGNLADAIYDLKVVMKSISDQNSKITSAINNIDRFSGSLVQIADANKNYINDSFAKIKDVSDRLDILISRIYTGSGTVSTLINDQQMGEDLKETITSAKETIKSLQDTVGRASSLQFQWDYLGRYNIKDEKFRNDIGITIMPDNTKFYYVGISNVADSDVTDREERDSMNRLEALLGFRFNKAEVYGGVMRGTAGVGAGYSFFEPIYAPYRTLQTFVNVYNMGREKRGPEVDAGARIGLTKWLSAGIMVEDVLYKTAVTPFVKLEIKDRDLAALLGIISIAAVSTK
ncbi:MAG: MlaD family protein [Endomicrobia bacterium]|nr:MlaD family protein [Endomicrobiia bacterium]MCL2507415.1 MlaD family protein [Endomicrobiia bacterium]